MKPIRCDECDAAGLPPGIIHEGFGHSTLAWNPPFIDADGHRHQHDTNATTTQYLCSHGHRWSVTQLPGTCWCGWKAGG